MAGMNYDEVVLGRRSIRGFQKRPVSRALISDILELAMRAPTSYNTQPWNFTVTSGSVLDAIRSANVANMTSGVPPAMDIRAHTGYADQHRQRQIAVAKQLFAAMGIERHDTAGRDDWVMRGFRQFDAPVSVIVTYDRSLHGGDIAAFDCGAVVNALVNAAWSRGLGCVINSQGIMQSASVRRIAGIPDDQVIMICVAMGWPDETFPANSVISERRCVDEAAVFLGFDEGNEART